MASSSSGLPTPRRSKTMPTEGHMTKFLYSILKQLDLKPIDWSLVATDLEISNGHAARMRYSRFKQQMEGTVSVPRTAKQPKKTECKKGDGAKGGKFGKGDAEKRVDSSSRSTPVKGGGGNASMTEMSSASNSKKRRASEQLVKNEMMSPHTPVGRRQQMEEFYAASNNSNSNNRTMMAPNGMMLNTPYPSPTPYAIPLRSPTTQFTMMSQEEMMMNRQPHSSSFGAANPYHPYGNVGPDYTYNPFAQGNLNHHSEYCFSGCCQPPPYPSTPNMYPSYPAPLSTPSNSTITPLTSQQQQQIHPQLLRPQKVWVPVKQEGGSEEGSDELLVKVETGGGSRDAS